MASEVSRPVSYRAGLGPHEIQNQWVLVRFKRAAFFFLRRIWFSISKQKIHNYYSSFLARCIVCNQIGGNSLNGHWKQVKNQHDKYRTDLVFVQDQLTFQFRPFQIPAIKNSEH